MLAFNKSRLDELLQQLLALAELFARFIRQKLLDKLHTQRAYLGLAAPARYQLLLQLPPEVAARVP